MPASAIPRYQVVAVGVFAAVLLLIAATMASSESSSEFEARARQEFEDFKVKFNRTYKDDEEVLAQLYH